GTEILGGGIGTLNIDAGGKLQINSGATLDGMSTNLGNTGIDVSAGILVLDDNAAFISGTLTIESSGEVVISAGTGSADSDDSVTTGGATLTSITVTDLNSSTADGSAGIEVTSGATLTLHATTIGGGGAGTLEVAAGGQLLIATGGATLNALIVDDDGTGAGSAAGIEVSAGILTLNSATQIQGGGSGTVNIDATGQLVIATGGATLDGVKLTDNNISTGAAAGIDVSGGLTPARNTQIIRGGPGEIIIGARGEVVITSGGNVDGVTSGTGATLDGVKLTNLNATTTDGSAGIEVSGGATLTLDDATTITSGTLAVESTAQLLIATGGATLNDVIVDDDGIGAGSAAGIEVSAGILTLNSATQIQGGGSGTVNIDATGQLVIATGGATLDGVKLTDNNISTGAAAGIDVSGGLTLDGNTQIIGGGSGTITIAASGELVITSGGNVDGVTSGTGATLDGVKLTNLNATTTDGSAGIEVSGGATLTLDDATTITSGTLAVESTAQLLIATGGATLND